MLIKYKYFNEAYSNTGIINKTYCSLSFLKTTTLSVASRSSSTFILKSHLCIGFDRRDQKI